MLSTVLFLVPLFRTARAVVSSSLLLMVFVTRYHLKDKVLYSGDIGQENHPFNNLIVLSAHSSNSSNGRADISTPVPAPIPPQSAVIHT